MSQQKASVVILDPQPEGQAQLQDLLAGEPLETRLLGDVQALFQAARERPIDCLLLGARGDLGLLRSVFQQRMSWMLDCPVIVVVEQGHVPAAVEAMRLGASTVLSLPLEPAALVRVLDEALEGVRKSGFTCEAEQSRQLLALADRVAQTDVTVLINGESGTGKEVLAQHVHLHSARAGRPFVAVNCASIPESMLEDMLFGHEKGAFTGAHQRHEGLFEQAHRGTLFLDEIGEMPLLLQAKILRVLQERELRRLGGSEVVRLDVRLITATNRDLAEKVRQREFREDLFYRLNVFPLKIAPLRERVQDILPIAGTLMAKHRAVMGRSCRLSQATRQFLQGYPWPGNVRELENVIQRAMVLAVDGNIEVEHLLLDQARPDAGPAAAAAAPVSTGQPLAAGPAAGSADAADPGQPAAAADSGLSDLTWKSESRVILDTLDRFGGNRKNTAEKLGISPRTLRYKLAKLKGEGVAIP